MVLVKINYASVSPIIKITYDETPVYIKTSVNNVYAKVVYGTSIKWGDIEGTLSDQTDLQNALDDKVPYTGATANVDLGEYELKAGQLTLDVSPTGTASVGTTRWNNTIGSSETTLKGGSVVLKNGVDLVARIVNKVTPNTTLTKAAYQAVRISGAQGQRLAVAFAQANNDNNSADTIGLVTETIATNQEGFIMTVGSLEGINTTGSLQGETWSDGDVLYLSPTVAGAITNIKPVAPQHLVVIGYVEYAHQNNGKIYVKIMNGWELGELHDVNTNGATNGQVLTYNGSIWVPSTNGVGTVTSVDMTVPTGLTVSGNPITSSGTLALGLASGYSIPTDANQTNWTAAYNDKINSAAVTGTTTKTLTLNQQDGGTITASWTDYDTAPVTSVFGRTGAVVATSGDYTTDQVTEGTNLYFTDARARAAISLTTTGTSGAATYVGGVLNIPQYQAALTNPVTGTGTAGQVAYWSGTNTQTGSNNLFWDATNSRLGIGTASPAYRLQVDGASTAGFVTPLLIKNPSTNAASSVKMAFDGGGTIWGEIGSSYNTNNPYMAFFVRANSEKMRITDGGNVAIGTLLPTSYGSYTTLCINNAGNGAVIDLLQNDIRTGSIYTSVSGAGLNINTVTSNPLIFLTANTERARFTSGGNLLVGATSDIGEKLQVNGNVILTSGYKIYGNSITGLVSSYISLYNPTDGGIDLMANFTTSKITFGTFGSERARFTAAGNLLIGTTTDGGQKLQVQGTSLLNGALSGTTATFNFGNFAGAGARFQYNSSNTPFVINALNNNGSAYIGWNVSAKSSVDTGTYILSQPATKIEGDGGSIRFYNAASGTAGADITFTERMRLDASGNLGLGVTPSAWRNIFNAFQIGYTGTLYSLTVSNATEQVNLASNYYQNSAGAELRVQAGFATRYQQGSGEHRWSTAASSTAGSAITFTQAMTLNASGNLGIGTTSTTKSRASILSSGGALPVLGQDVPTSNLFLTQNNTWGMYIGLEAATGKGYIQQMRNDSATSYPLILQPVGGNLLVGTTTDGGQRLQVSGTMSVTGAATFSSSVTANLGMIVNGYTLASSGLNLEFGIISGYTQFNSYNRTTSSFAGVRIDGSYVSINSGSGGNLGIGTASPAYNLHLVSSSTSVAAFRNSAAAIGQILVGNTVSDLAIRILASGDSLIFSDTGKYLAFGSNGATERMRIDSSGNLGIGVTPSAWSASYKALQIGNSLAFLGASAAADIYFNAFFDGTNFKYISSTSASLYSLSGGQHRFYNAPVGTAGNNITFTQAMTLAATGNLLVGTTTDGGQRLQVSGTMSVTGAATFSSSATATSFIPSGSTVPTNGIYLPSANTLGFATNSAERIRITSTGLVGIGSDAPYSNLQIQGASDTRLVVQVVGTEVAGDRAGLYFKSAIQYTDSYLKAAVIFQNNGTGFGRGDLILAVNNGAGGTNVSPSDAKLTIAANGTATFSSSVTAASYTVNDAGNIAVGTTTGTKIGTATSQKIGFWNATPIVQPTTAVAAAAFVANTGTAVNDASTFDGYTMAQVVKALRNAGLLA